MRKPIPQSTSFLPLNSKRLDAHCHPTARLGVRGGETIAMARAAALVGGHGASGSPDKAEPSVARA